MHGFLVSLLATTHKFMINYHSEFYYLQSQLNYCARRGGPKRKVSGFVKGKVLQETQVLRALLALWVWGEEAMHCSAPGALPCSSSFPINFCGALATAAPVQ